MICCLCPFLPHVVCIGFLSFGLNRFIGYFVSTHLPSDTPSGAMKSAGDHEIIYRLNKNSQMFLAPKIERTDLSVPLPSSPLDGLIKLVLGSFEVKANFIFFVWRCCRFA